MTRQIASSSVGRRALADTRIVIVNGARQSGKSIAGHRLVRDLPGVIERKLDRPNDLTGRDCWVCEACRMRWWADP